MIKAPPLNGNFNMNNPLSNIPHLSVIIPIYNTGQYIAECLDSLVQQKTTKKFEIILVNDATPDDAGQIALRYQENYPNLIRFFEQQTNQGVSAARNVGIALAQGRYILFVDSDDLLPKNAIQNWISATEKYDADVYQGCYQLIWPHKLKSPSRLKKSGKLNGNDVLGSLLIHKHVKGHPWAKLFKASICKELQFDTKAHYTQDLLFCSEFFSKAKSLRFIKSEVYLYRKNDEGATGNKYKTNKYLIWLNNINKIEKIINSQDNQKNYIYFQTKALSLLTKECNQLPQEQKTSCINKAWPIIKGWPLTPLDILKKKIFSLTILIRQYKSWKRLKTMSQKIKL